MISKLIFIIFSIILTLLFFYNKKRGNVKLSKIFLVLLLLFLSIVFTFRDNIFPNDIGTDYYEYKNWFELRNFGNLQFEFKNFGFNFLISVLKLFTNNYYVFLFICGLLINYLIISFIIENTDDVLFSATVYYCLMYFLTFNVLRQWIACAIFLYAFKFIKNHSPVKYTFSILIASTFHDTAIIMLALYPLLLFKNMSFYKEEMFSLLIAIFAFFKVDYVVKIMNSICLLLGLDYFQKYSSEYLLSQSGNSTFLIISIIILILLNFKLYDNENNSTYKNILIRYFLYLLPFSALSMKNGIFTRYLIYFELAIVPAIDFSFSLFERKSRVALKTITLFLIILNFIF